MRLRRDRPCNVCGRTPTHQIRERIPGSKGRMAQSFAGTYRLCDTCLAIARRVGSIERIEEKTKRYEERITVLGKTFQFLKAKVSEGTILAASDRNPSALKMELIEASQLETGREDT